MSMKLKSKTRGFLIFLILSSLITSCREYIINTYQVFSNSAMKTPQGYVSQTEVSVHEWLTYMVATTVEMNGQRTSLKQQVEIMKSKMPDLSQNNYCSYVFSSFFRTSDKMSEIVCYDDCLDSYCKIEIAKSALDSINKNRLLDLPVTGVSWEQVQQFLKYKQKLTNECDHKRLKRQPSQLYECYLPTPAQFDSVLTALDSINSFGCELFNYKNALCPDCPGSKKKLKSIMGHNIGNAAVWADSYFPNDFGLYNLKGNVAEMTSEKGIAKGGSFMHYATEADSGKVQTYSTSEVWLGFRVWYRLKK
ncbi:MAG: SUMF1/EgtB/PvdO family nonheme iron enzyme [Bacteroidetes bacterium]|nr:SUMF1/EgtB/PvdO family nonheme iron enzyme [Bacteroidota bacterium]